MKTLSRPERFRSALRVWSKFMCGALLVAIGPLAHGAPSTLSTRMGLAIPVSLLEVMRAAVEIPADGIWEAQSADKVTDDAWLLVDQDSVSLASAATLISMGGIGKKDRQWVAQADWQAWARDVQKTALAIRAAGEVKDSAKLGVAADHLAEVCQNCHMKYRPEIPSDGVARYPFYPKRELKTGK